MKGVSFLYNFSIYYDIIFMAIINCIDFSKGAYI
jgi:hypothetical protein